MKKRPLKARQPGAGEDVERIALSVAAGYKAALGKIAVINLALRGIEADFGPEQADAFRLCRLNRN